LSDLSYMLNKTHRSKESMLALMSLSTFRLTPFRSEDGTLNR
jgi:hypothetical protein